MRWGLVPSWAKDIKVGFANITAKAEGDQHQARFPPGVRTVPCPGRQFL
jgi:putative SOS response-associated peptidase YedK